MLHTARAASSNSRSVAPGILARRLGYDAQGEQCDGWRTPQTMPDLDRPGCSSEQPMVLVAAGTCADSRDGIHDRLHVIEMKHPQHPVEDWSQGWGNT
jgi:hypothetical protein